MKTLKITLMMFAVIAMTMSGTSSDELTTNQENVKKYNTYDLIAHGKKQVKLPCNG